MKRIGFLITNPNHHWQLVEPIVTRLKKVEIATPIIISFCGLRRMDEPIRDLQHTGIEYRLGPSLKKIGINRSSGRASLGAGASLRRKAAQFVAWHCWLKFCLPQLFEDLDGLLLLNDVAYPTSSVLNLIRRKKRIWLGLLQEGIRFPLPNESIEENYAGSELDHVFAWGESSANFFASKRQGNKPKITITGNPRINQKLETNLETAIQPTSSDCEKRGPIIGLASNPIDDQGFCSNPQKLKLLYEFFYEALAFLISNRGELWIKLHPRENVEEIMSIILKLNAAKHIKIFEENCVFSFISTVDRVIIMASTVGLESLALGKPIAVLPIPGFGFVHDYVSKGAALGLEFGRINEQLALWEDSELSTDAQAYVEQNLSVSSPTISLICETIKSELSTCLA
jgi:hypothetical protein